MKVLFVSPEVNPIVRTGGLGDVVGSLPLALSELLHLLNFLVIDHQKVIIEFS